MWQEYSIHGKGFSDYRKKASNSIIRIFKKNNKYIISSFLKTKKTKPIRFNACFFQVFWLYCLELRREIPQLLKFVTKFIYLIIFANAFLYYIVNKNIIIFTLILGIFPGYLKNCWGKKYLLKVPTIIHLRSKRGHKWNFCSSGSTPKKFYKDKKNDLKYTFAKPLDSSLQWESNSRSICAIYMV